MAQVWTTSQTDTLIANAGLTQTINVQSGQGSSYPSSGLGAGVSIASGGSGPNAIGSPSWAVWALMIALVWMGYNWMK